MKKHILTGFLLAFTALAAQAQQRMVLVMDDGTEKTYESWQVDKIYFKDAEAKVSPKTAPRLLSSTWDLPSGHNSTWGPPVPQRRDG